MIKTNVEEDILPKLTKVKRNNNGWIACCPSHNDKNPSLSIAEKDGKILFKCFAGCSFEQIVQALGLNERERVNKVTPKFGFKSEKAQKKIVAVYNYEDEKGKTIYQAVRFEPKTFSFRRPDEKGNWIWDLQGVRKVPYHLPELIQAKENNLPVFICEGEKDADNIRGKLDFIATTMAQGSNGWNDDYTEFFDDLEIIILPDNDEPGRKYADEIALSLWGVSKSVKIIQLPNLISARDKNKVKKIFENR